MLYITRGRVAVKRKDTEKVSKGGIVIPDTATEKPQSGEVVKVGEGDITNMGHTLPVEMKVGDTVWFAKWGGNEVETPSGPLVILNQSEILCVESKPS